MSERIKQLGMEAGLYVDLNGKPWPKWMSAEECELAYQKFAELIVKDCVNIIEGYCETSPEIWGLPLDVLEHFDMEFDDPGLEGIEVDESWDAEEELQKLFDEFDMSQSKDKGE